MKWKAEEEACIIKKVHEGKEKRDREREGRGRGAMKSKEGVAKE